MLLLLWLVLCMLQILPQSEYDRYVALVAAHRALIMGAAIHDFGNSSASVVYVDPGAFVQGKTKRQQSDMSF